MQARLREAAAGRYFMHVKSKVSPHLFGEPVHRPRVFIRMIRTDQCLVSSEDEFQQALKDADHELSGSDIYGNERPRRAIAYLESRGFLKPRTESAGNKHEPAGQCPCCLSIKQGKPPNCHLHPCCCRGCKNPGPWVACSWAPDHSRGWFYLRKNMAKSKSKWSYFAEAKRRGLPVDSVASTPRLRNLIELEALCLWSADADPFSSELEARLDTSLPFGRQNPNIFGWLPTITRTSEIFAFRLGVVLQPVELLYLMGFPVSAYRDGLVNFDDSSLRRMAGNTTHPGVAGLMLLGVLGLLKHPASDATVGEFFED